MYRGRGDLKDDAMMRVAIAMSGGVDSSVAAALLKKAGHDVSGVTMQIRDDSRAVKSAAAVARRLGIPHRVIDLRDVFARRVIDYFCREYRAGRTPNPCIVCNRYIKFGALREEVEKAGAEMLATGHYARIEKVKDGRYILKKGRDPQKDQSYFLCQLTQEQLGRTLFPLGEMTKDEVKKLAAEMGLPAVDRPESQEVCFIPDSGRAQFLENYSSELNRPGPITDEGGRTLGQHRGAATYTIGQRRGLGIAAPEPLYVTAIESLSNTVVVGTREQAYGTELIAGGLNWIAMPPPRHPVKFKAKIRYRQAEAEATVTPLDDNTLYVKFNEPQMAIAPGQAIVFYDGDRVAGGGTIIKRGKAL
jgi:tRNA-specific 2-thiouridylase